jgi:hypothetical protein
MPFVEDLAPFFNTADFATDATLAGVAVKGIFDNQYLLEDVGGGVAVSGPVFTLASSAVPANVAGATLVVSGVTYKVVEPMPDGTGVTALRLRT